MKIPDNNKIAAFYERLSQDNELGDTNFDHPDWKLLTEDIGDNKIGCVIVKGMNRIGRNYLQIGFYSEVLFREKNVKFIAISNEAV